MPEMPVKCPECGSTDIACVKIPGTGWMCTCAACGKNWTKIETMRSATAAFLVFWVLMCLAFFVSIAALKRVELQW